MLKLFVLYSMVDLGRDKVVEGFDLAAVYGGEVEDGLMV